MPPGVSRSKMRHISQKDLFAALNLDLPGLEAVREAATTGRWKDACSAWGAYFAGRKTGRNLVDRFERRPGPDAIEQAERLVKHEITYQGWQTPTYRFGKRVDFNADWGQSGKYGMHYWFWSDPLRVAYAKTGELKFAECFQELFNQWYDQRDDIENTIPHLDVIFYELGIGGRNPQFVDHYCAYRNAGVFGWRTHERILKTILGGCRWLDLLEREGYVSGNWQLTGSFALVYCGGLFHEFREAGDWIEIGMRRIAEHAEKDFFADGCHSERTAGYGVVSLRCVQRTVDFADLNPHVRLPEPVRSRLAEMYEWFLATATPLGESIGFNDGGFARQDDLLEEAVRFTGSGRYLWPVRDRIPSIDRVRPEKPSFSSINLAPSGYAVMRSGWDRDALYMVINYGAWGGGHSHNDLLDFSMYAYGRPLALETTRWGSYDNPLNHYFRSPRAHNQVVVNDAPLDRVNHRGEDVEWVSGKEVDYFSARHRGYEKEFGVILERRIVFLKPRYFLISDTILETERHHAYTWYLHDPFRWKAGKRTSVAGGDPGLQVVPARPSEIRYVRQGVSYVESDGAPHPYPNRYWIGFQKWISSRNQFSMNYDVALVPFRKTPSRVGVARVPVHVNGRRAPLHLARGIRVERNRRTDLIVYGTGEGDRVRCGDLSFRGRLCVASFENGRITYGAVAHGDEVAYKGRTLIREELRDLNEWVPPPAT